MTDTKNRLTDIIEQSGMLESRKRSEIVADELILNDVIVPPCAVGTTVYLPRLDDEGEIETYTIIEFVLDVSGLYFVVDDEDRERHLIEEIGKECFLLKDQAEQKLKESE